MTATAETTPSTAETFGSLHKITFVDIILWGLRIAMLAVVVGGTIGTLIKGTYSTDQWLDFFLFGLTIGGVYALIALGYSAVSAPDGPTALNRLRNGEYFDLLFTDVVMPGGMNGRQLADEAVKIRPGIKVLYTSGYTDDTIMRQGRLDEGVLLLQKPYRKGQLAEMIRKALGG